jgi:hypothetical protein
LDWAIQKLQYWDTSGLQIGNYFITEPNNIFFTVEKEKNLKYYRCC